MLGEFTHLEPKVTLPAGQTLFFNPTSIERQFPNQLECLLEGDRFWMAFALC